MYASKIRAKAFERIQQIVSAAPDATIDFMHKMKPRAEVCPDRKHPLADEGANILLSHALILSYAAENCNYCDSDYEGEEPEAANAERLEFEKELIRAIYATVDDLYGMAHKEAC